MLGMRGSLGRSSVAAAFAFICLCVLMQVLGTTMTLWDFELQLDPVNAPLLEGFSVPSDASHILPPVMIASLIYAVQLSPVVMQDRLFFRPPIFL